MKQFELNNLRVASPCSMSWNEMKGDERKRHCASCDLNVYNIAEMSSSEVASLISATNGQFCAKLFRRADGTVLTKDCPVGLKSRRRRVARFASATFAAILGGLSLSYGQQEDTSGDGPLKVDAAKVKPVQSAKHTSHSLVGTVTDPNGALVPDVKLVLYLGGKKLMAETATDSEGRFFFPTLAKGIYELHLKGPIGFRKHIVQNLELAANQSTEITVELQVNSSFEELLGVIGVEPLIEMSTEVKTVFTGEMLDRIPGRRIPFD